MSFQERRSLMSMVSTVLIVVVYSALMIQRYPQADAYAPEVFHFWGAFFLILIPVTVAAKIVLTIVFYIANAIATREEGPEITDERDRLIELKATSRSLYVFSAGVILAMAALVLSQPPAVMFIIFICAGVVSEIVSDLSQFYFYRRGF